MNNNKINVENDWNNVITVSNTNIKRSEKLAENYANSAKKDMQECANYLALAQRILRECENVKDSINVSMISELQEHTEDIENPHSVTAEQVNAYSKSDIDDFLAMILLDNYLNIIISGNNEPEISQEYVGSELNEIIGG